MNDSSNQKAILDGLSTACIECFVRLLRGKGLYISENGGRVLFGFWVRAVCNAYLASNFSDLRVPTKGSISATTEALLMGRHVTPISTESAIDMLANVPFETLMFYSESSTHATSPNHLAKKNRWIAYWNQKLIEMLLSVAIGSILRIMRITKVRGVTLFYKPQWPPGPFIRMAISCRLLCFPLPETCLEKYKSPDSTHDKNLRIQLQRELALGLGGHKYLIRILVHYTPISLLESVLKNFQEMESYYDAYYKRTISVICSSVGWYYDDEFKLFAAVACSDGITLCGLQHGGNYEFIQGGYLNIDRYVTQKYVAWGSRGNESLCLPSPKLNMSLGRRRRKPLSTNDGGFAYISTSYPREVQDERFNEGPQRGYIEDAENFITTFRELSGHVIKFRPYPGDRFCEQSIAAAMKRNGIRYQLASRQSFVSLIDNTAVVLLDNLNTVYLECLFLDIPVIIYLNPKRSYNVVSETGLRDYARLKRAGVIHETVESVRVQLKTIATHDVQGWWTSPRVKLAVREFLMSFAESDGGYVHHWAEFVFKNQATFLKKNYETHN